MSETKKYAGFWIRFCAGVLDIAFLIFPFAVISFSFGLADINSIGDSLDSSSPHSSTLNFISYGISIIYLGYFLSSKKTGDHRQKNFRNLRRKSRWIETEFAKIYLARASINSDLSNFGNRIFVSNFHQRKDCDA